MTSSTDATRELQARIVYFGAQGAGTSENLRYIHRKLRAEHRGELRTHGPADGRHEFLPIELGMVGGHKTSIQLYTVPGGEAHLAKRRELCEAVDGIVFVADLRPTRHEATVAALDELRGHLKSYGRSLEDVLLIVQYNRRDLVDENAIEALHRRLGLDPDCVFESVASEGTGVLQTLTSLSKLILRRLRDATTAPEASAREPAPAPAPVEHPPVVATAPTPEREPSEPRKPFEIEDAGPARVAGCEVRVPIVLVEPGTGRRVELCLRLSLESLQSGE
ncbi:MAG: ATP/GTP-binding protein [Myxococcota bacterium]